MPGNYDASERGFHKEMGESCWDQATHFLPDNYAKISGSESSFDPAWCVIKSSSFYPTFPFTNKQAGEKFMYQ